MGGPGPSRTATIPSDGITVRIWFRNPSAQNVSSGASGTSGPSWISLPPAAVAGISGEVTGPSRLSHHSTSEPAIRSADGRAVR